MKHFLTKKKRYKKDHFLNNNRDGYQVVLEETVTYKEFIKKLIPLKTKKFPI